MDADIAASVVDDAFEAFGTPDCRYVPPGGGAAVTGITLLRHRRMADRNRPGLSLGRGGLETTDRPQSILVRSREAQPLMGGLFVMPSAGGERQFAIGEDPVEDDVHGIAWRCSVSPL